MSTDLLQFGVPLQIVLSRYGEHIIPRLLKEIVMILYQCAEVVDIFRLLVGRTELNEIIEEINSTASDKFTPILTNLNPHIVANLFLVYLDLIPGGLISLDNDQDIDWLIKNANNILCDVGQEKKKVLVILLSLLLHFDKARVPGTNLKELATIFGPIVIRFGNEEKHSMQSFQKAIIIFSKLCEEDNISKMMNKNPLRKTLVQKEIPPITQQRILVDTLIEDQELRLKLLKTSLQSLKHTLKHSSSSLTPEEVANQIRIASTQFQIPKKFSNPSYIPKILDSKLQVISGHFSEQGRRKTMEDQVVHFDDFNSISPLLLPNIARGLWAVYDGHGGVADSKVTALCNTPIWVGERHHLDIAYFLSLAEQEMHGVTGDAYHQLVLNALKLAVYRTDKYIYQQLQKLGDKSGSTSVVCYQENHTLYLSNLGDSECVMGSSESTNIPANFAMTAINSNTILPYTAKLLSFPHKPEKERKRIEELGGNVTNSRVAGLLGVSRAFGDISFKKDSHRSEYWVSVEPFLAYYHITHNDKFVILACDGLWDVITYQGAVDFVANRLERGENPEAVAEALVDKAFNELKSQDNISVIVVAFKWS